MWKTFWKTIGRREKIAMAVFFALFLSVMGLMVWIVTHPVKAEEYCPESCTRLGLKWTGKVHIGNGFQCECTNKE